MKPFPDQKIVRAVRREYPVGTIVALEEMDDSQAPPIGTLGIVSGVDDIGSICVHWANHSSLHVVYGVDRCRVISKPVSIPEFLLKFPMLNTQKLHDCFNAVHTSGLQHRPEGYYEVEFVCSRNQQKRTTTWCEETNCPRYSSCDTIAAVLDVELLINFED